jgi:FkbM family methyltransferase
VLSSASRLRRRILPSGPPTWSWRGLDVTLESRSAIAHDVRKFGSFEQAEIDVAAALFVTQPPGRCILDVGANVGLHTLVWSRLAPVVAFEPAPTTFERLQANIVANALQDRIRTLRTAVGSEVGEVDFFVTTDSAFSSMKDTRRRRVSEKVRVPCTTLDALMPSLATPVGLVKIDVEGFERAVIRGATELIERDRPVLFVEIYGGTVRDIEQLGYDAYVYARSVGLLPYESHRDDRYNYFFIPRRTV